MLSLLQLQHLVHVNKRVNGYKDLWKKFDKDFSGYIGIF
jgi:hypothetical protein